VHLPRPLDPRCPLRPVRSARRRALAAFALSTAAHLALLLAPWPRDARPLAREPATAFLLVDAAHPQTTTAGEHVEAPPRAPRGVAVSRAAAAAARPTASAGAVGRPREPGASVTAGAPAVVRDRAPDPPAAPVATADRAPLPAAAVHDGPAPGSDPVVSDDAGEAPGDGPPASDGDLPGGDGDGDGDGDAEQDRARVADRVDRLARDALPPRLDDPPGYPELHLDDDGNLTWRFYDLRLAVRPDGSVAISRGPIVRRGGGYADRYCRALAVTPGTCDPLPTVPWPAEWGQPIGRAPAKSISLWFLARTERLRDDLADRFEAQRLAPSAAKAASHAAAVWTSRDLAPATRRRHLFELWDECEEPRDHLDDRPVARAGETARRQIVAYIRRELPPGSPLAFTAPELAALNAVRASRERFAPYGAP
jgi:hypothetical protein